MAIDFYNKIDIAIFRHEIKPPYHVVFGCFLF
jgi:hypothetical protein